MKNRKNLIAIGLIYVLILVAVMCANADVPKGSIGFTYNNVASETGWGLLATLPYEIDDLKGYTHATIQKSSTVLRTKYHAEVGTSFQGWDLNIYTNGRVKQYTGAAADRTSGVGLALEAPEQQIGVFSFTAGIGIEGQNGGQIGSPNAGDTLEALGYDPEVLESLGMYTVHPAPTGLSLQQGNALKGVGYAELRHVSGVLLSLKGLPEIASQSESPVHQLIATIAMNIDLRAALSLDIGMDVGVQTFAGEFEYETATLIAAKYSF